MCVLCKYKESTFCSSFACAKETNNYRAMTLMKGRGGGLGCIREDLWRAGK